MTLSEITKDWVWRKPESLRSRRDRRVPCNVRIKESVVFWRPSDRKCYKKREWPFVLSDKSNQMRTKNCPLDLVLWRLLMALIKMVSEEQWCENLTILYSREIKANIGNSFKEFQWIRVGSWSGKWRGSDIKGKPFLWADGKSSVCKVGKEGRKRTQKGGRNTTAISLKRQLGMRSGTSCGKIGLHWGSGWFTHHNWRKVNYVN